MNIHDIKLPNVKLINRRKVLHKVAFNYGPYIGEIETIEVDGVRYEIDIWYDGNHKLYKRRWRKV